VLHCTDAHHAIIMHLVVGVLGKRTTTVMTVAIHTSILLKPQSCWYKNKVIPSQNKHIVRKIASTNLLVMVAAPMLLLPQHWCCWYAAAATPLLILLLLLPLLLITLLLITFIAATISVVNTGVSAVSAASSATPVGLKDQIVGIGSEIRAEIFK